MRKTNNKNSFLIISFFLIILLSATFSQAQPWRSNLPQDKIENETLTFFDYQKAFYSYWEPYHVEEGYYYENGKKIKASGWKQFKRWEWFWEGRVDPVTGAFPEKTAWDVYQEYLEENPEAARSISGNWVSMGPNSTGGGYAGLGRLSCVAFRTGTPDIIYVGAAAGGIWKTTDGGSTWKPLGDKNDALGVSDIIVIETDSDDILYIATGDRDAGDTYSVGVLKSTDGGSTWEPTELSWSQGQQRRINRLLVDSNDNLILYASTTIGLYKTTNGGDNWDLKSSRNFIDIEFKPENNAVIYGSTTGGTIYKSTDSGETWTLVYSITGGKRTQLAVSFDDPSVVYALSSNSSSGLNGVYKSTDSGDNWSLVYNAVNMLGWDCDGGGTGGQGWYDLCIASDPSDANIVLLGGVNTWKSTDGGHSWNISNHWSGSCGGTATNVHADKHFLAYQPDTGHLFECNDGGIYKTTNNGDSWIHIGSGLVTSQMYRLGVSQTSSNDVITGLQDNGSKAMLYGNWADVLGGDGMECVIDHTNEAVQYAEYYFGNIYRTKNHWASSTGIKPSGSSGAWITPYCLDVMNSRVIYAGYQDVYKSTDQGNSWTTISSNIAGGTKLHSLTVAPSNNFYIYTATSSKIYQTKDGGTNWTDITGNLPGSNNITYISVKHNDPNTVWVSFSGFNNDKRVYETTDGGENWTNISDGLPQLPVNCVIQNRQNTTFVELYCATDVGVYVKVGDTDWKPFFDGLPNVVVDELEIYYDNTEPANSRIRAATYGRGLWESDLLSTVILPVADFSADNVSPTTIDTVLFSDLSSNVPDTWLWSFSPATVSFIDGTDENTQNPKVLFNEAGLYTVEMIAANVAGSDTMTKTDYIDVKEVLAVEVVASPDSICYGESSQLEAVPSGGTGSYSFNWTSDPEGFQSTEQNPFVSPEITTTFMVEVNDEEQTAVANIEIAVTPLPEITLGDWPEELCNTQESPVQLTATPEGGIFSGEAVTEDGEFSPEEALLGWNVITYSFADENGCESRAADSVYVNDCSGIFDNASSLNSKVHVFPNPNKGFFTIESSEIIYKVEIINTEGKTVFLKDVNDKKLIISTISAKGLYLVRIYLIGMNKDPLRIVNKKLIIN